VVVKVKRREVGRKGEGGTRRSEGEAGVEPCGASELAPKSQEEEGKAVELSGERAACT
jgi:hypothetical protein